MLDIFQMDIWISGIWYLEYLENRQMSLASCFILYLCGYKSLKFSQLCEQTPEPTTVSVTLVDGIFCG